VSAHDFSGRQVVITGASRGLGRACADAFATARAEVILVARARPELEDLAANLRSRGARARAIACDVTDDAQVEQLFAGLERCDVLVNNAGTNRPQPFLDVDPATLDEIIRLNVRSMFIVAQAAARRMVPVRAGAIVNMSSQMGHVGGPNRTVYCLTKHAIEGLTKAMAIELAPHGVRVNSVAPTYIETPLTKPFLSNETFREDVLRRIPLGRVGTVEEVAAAVLFLASSDASLVTGTSLLVDGGYTAQ
jgi:NAD(P)-dependent dehydrogenase (short-subunit alcohol dehydrogenase family)